MSLLTIFKSEELVNGQPLSLDDLWQRAEHLGIVGVDKDWTNGAPYKVTIIAWRKSGSRVHAFGSDAKIYNALGKAIEEAERLLA